MKPVYQTTFGDGKGNCFAACLASILHDSIEDVPNFCVDCGERWWEATQRWLGLRGLFAIEFTIHRPDDGGWFSVVPPSVHFLATGKSPRGDFLHCVVGRFTDDGRFDLVHDPHPSGAFLAGPPESVMFLGATDPEGSSTCGARWDGKL